MHDLTADPAAAVSDPHVLICLDPAALGPAALGPAAVGPAALGPAAVGPAALGPAAVGPAALGPMAPPSPARWLAGHQGAPVGWALPEDGFEHRDSMITKAEVRALVLARLGPGPGRTVWDVGAGSGSVAVECARFGAWAVAIESDDGQCARIRRNAAGHGVRLQVVAAVPRTCWPGCPPRTPCSPAAVTTTCWPGRSRRGNRTGWSSRSRPWTGCAA